MGARLQSVEAASDAALISSSLTRPEMFGRIFDRHFGAVHRYLARRAGRWHADDLASQTFVVAFERRASFRTGELGARAWLFGIATNLLRNDWRAEQRRLDALARLSADPATAIAPDGGPVYALDCDLAAALAAMDREQRDVLLLHAWGEMSYEEIAGALSIPVGTVRSRLSRARLHLRSHLTSTPAHQPAGLTVTREERT